VASLLFATVFLGGSGAFGVILYILDRLVSPVDCDGPDTSRLDELEKKLIATYFVPMAKSVDPIARAPSDDDIETVRTGYNYQISRIERGRYCAQSFTASNRNLSRGLAGAAVCLAIPGTASLIYTPSGALDPLAYLFIACVVGIVGSLGFATYALGQMRKLRQHYHDAVGPVEGILSAKKLNDSLNHAEAGK
jgi:hypothetical protein